MDRKTWDYPIISGSRIIMMGNRKGYTLKIFMRIMLLTLLIVGVVDASTITVDDSGGADYTLIQDAIDNASDGDTILVANGTYYEQISINRNNLNIIGYERNSTIIHGGWSTDRVVDVRANNVHFSGFTVSNSGWKGIGLYLYNTMNFTFINNTLKDNYYSMQMNNSNNNLIDSNNISQTNYYYYFQDITITSSSNNIFNRNTVDRGIGLTNSSNNDFIENSVSNLLIDAGSNRNKFMGNKFGSLSIGSYSEGLYPNENIIRNNEAQSFFIYNSNQNIIEGNNISSIDIYSSNNNIINNNTIPQSYYQSYYNGISLSNSSHNTIFGNNITGGYYTSGLFLGSNSKNNTISNNLIQSAGEYSIYMIWSNSNKVYLNTFNSAKNALDHNGFNLWDNAGKGNYWSDYSGQDNNSDGIGDTPYLKIDTNADAKDNYPLMTPPCNCTLLPIPTPTPDISTGPSPGNVTRSFSSNIVSPNAIVTITISPDENLPAGMYYTWESIPAGFSFINTTAWAFSYADNVYTLKQLETTQFNYTLKAPAANGTYTFNGTFKDFDGGKGTVGGAIQITVREEIDIDVYLPPGASPAERKAGVIKATEDYFDRLALTKTELLSILDSYFEN